jgi:hypothetical protein
LLTWFRQPLLIVEKKERVVAVCAGRPSEECDRTWEGLQVQASEILEAARLRLDFTKEGPGRPRGNFDALMFGMSYGGGQKHPMVLAQDPGNERVLEEVLKEGVFSRISGFAAGTWVKLHPPYTTSDKLYPAAAFAEWAPNLYCYQNRYLDLIINHDEELRQQGKHPNPKEKRLCRNLPRTPWAAASFNLGPQTVCLRHVDSKNLPVGWCAVTALGNFDYRKGGHLVLWELKLVIEFPAGSTILIPSAIIQHSNNPSSVLGRCFATSTVATRLLKPIPLSWTKMRRL